jgi:hypothetical protein
MAGVEGGHVDGLSPVWAHASRLATKPHTVRNDTTAASRCNSLQPSEEGYTGPRFWAFHLFSDSGRTARLCDWYGLNFVIWEPSTQDLQPCLRVAFPCLLAPHLTWVSCVRYPKHFWSFV